mgnify:CR=1 FL=1
MLVTISRNGVSIRLTEERWQHILSQHPELSAMQLEVLDTVASPERILAGNEGAAIAVRETKPRKWLVVIYREESEDGFISTAFFTNRKSYLDRRIQLWP